MSQLNNIIKLSLLGFLLGVVFSCKPIYKSVNGIDKNIAHTSKADYKTKIANKYGIDTSRMVFIDSIQKNNFFYHLQTEKISYIYGIIVNQKLKVDNTFVNENNSCYLRITNLINDNPLLKGEKLITNNVLDFNFVDESNNKINIKEDKVLLFVFSTKLGKTTINDIKDVIKEFSTNENFNTFTYYLISVD